MLLRKLIAIASCATALMFAAVPASATIATYKLSGTFTSGAAISGNFVYNNATKQVTSFLITVGEATDSGYCDGWFCDGFAPSQTYSSVAGDRGFLNGNRWISFAGNNEFTYTDRDGEQITMAGNYQFSLGIGPYVNCPTYSCPSTIGPLTATKLLVNFEEYRTFYDDGYGSLVSASRGTSSGYFATLVSLVDPAPVVPPSRPVPEPGTLALLAGGFALLGLTRRRRRVV